MSAPTPARALPLDPAHRNQKHAKQHRIDDKGYGAVAGQENKGSDEQQAREDRQHNPTLPDGRQTPAPTITLSGEPVFLLGEYEDVSILSTADGAVRFFHDAPSNKRERR